MADKATVDSVIFNGGYGYDYVSFAANIAQAKFAGSTFKVAPSTQIAQQLQPRFVGGNPPDLIDNSGANQIGFNTILDQLSTLDDVFEANNYEGTKIADTLYPGAKLPGTFDGKFVAMNYVLTLYGLWYSESLFKENGWEPPKTYDALLDLGAKAKAKGKYLFVWGKEAATYYHTLAVDSRDQGGWRRRPAGAGEPQGELLVAAADPGCLQGPGDHGQERVLRPGRRRHPVHRRAGEVEQRPAGHPLPLGLVDRERDEEGHQERASR